MFADEAEFATGLFTSNISSDVALNIYSGHNSDILLEAGEGGVVVVTSDVSLDEYTITAKTFVATESLLLGNVSLDIASSTFSTSAGDMTFAPAENGRMLLRQDMCVSVTSHIRHSRTAH